MSADLKKKIEKQIGNYYILNEVLGQGNQAICKKAIKKNNFEEIFAVKILKKSELKETANHEQKLKQLQQEILSMQKLHNLNIVKIIEICQTDNSIYLFLEYCNQGSLDQWLKRRNGRFSETEVILIIKQFKSAFCEMYQQNVIHRDLKPQNILVHNGKIKIADFGFARTVDDMDKLEPRTFLGTPLFIPIEIFQHLPYSSKCDIFSLGVTIFFLFYGCHPYYSKHSPKNHYDLLTILSKKDLHIPESPIPENKNLLPLLIKMLQIYEEDRISWPEFFNDKFFKDLEEEESSLKSKIENESDMFNQSQYQNKLYLNTHLIQDQLILQKQEETSPTQQEVCSPTQNSSIVLSSNLFKELLSKYTQIELEQYIRQLHYHVLYERNIGMFYFDIIEQIWSLQAFKKIELPDELYYEFLYIISKIGLICLNNLQLMLNNSESNFPIVEDQQIIKYFKTQTFFTVDTKMVIYCSFHNFQVTRRYLKLNECIHACKLKNQQYLSLNSFQKYKIFEKIKQTAETSNLFYEITQEMFQFFYVRKATLTREVLLLLLFIQIGMNPYKIFVKNGVQFPDFYMIYDNFKKMKREELLTQIEKNLQ